MNKTKILIITATHGDEGFSIPVVESIMNNYPANLTIDWIVGNPKALNLNTRFVECDLNRCSPGNLNSKLYEERRAAEIIDLSKNYDFVIDIHGTDADCGICTIIPNPIIPNLLLANLVGLKNNIIWNAPESKNKGPLVQFMKCPAIEIECGRKGDVRTAEDLKSILVDFLNRISERSFNIQEQQWYKAIGPIEVNQPLKDFDLISFGNRNLFAFLSNQYKNNLCIGLEELIFSNLFFTETKF
jgi:hypothetical protein